MDGVEFASRYSYITNRLGYCGRENANRILWDYVTSGAGRSRALEALEGFEGLNPYLRLIARKNKREAFDYEVAEAYWLGNGLLDKVDYRDIQDLIRKEFPKYLTKPLAAKLAGDVPEDVTPHHSFHVLHIMDVRSLTGRVPKTSETLKNCIISWGKVGEVKDDSLVLNKKSLSVVPGKYGMTDETAEVSYDPHFTGDVSEGNTVSVHWNWAVQVLEDRQAKKLEEYTAKNIRAVNRHRA